MGAARWAGRALFSALTASLVLAILTACSTDGHTPSPYSGDLESAQEQATSEFERGVFADLTISRAEYDEATQRFADCLTAGGYQTIKVESDGIYSYEIAGKADDEAFDLVSEACRLGTVQFIEPLYVDMTRNPGKDDYLELIAKCLVAADVVDAPFTSKELQEFMTTVDGTGTNVPTPPWADDDPRVAQCFERPAG